MTVRPEEGAAWTPPRTSIESIAWPPLPAPEAVRFLALGQQLDESQWWPPEVMREHQLAQLRELLAHAAATLPFWRERLDAAGIATDRPPTWEGFTKLPILTRADVQALGQRLRTERIPRGHGNIVTVRTTGATARPASFAQSAASLAMSEAFALRGHAWRGDNPTGKLAVIRTGESAADATPGGRRIANWGRPVAVVYPTGPAVFLDIGASTARQVEWLRRERPDILVSPASNLLALAQHCLSQRVALEKLRAVQPMDETVTPELRKACHDAWGIAPRGDYTAREAGVIALQCPGTEHYHAQSEAMITEVLDSAGRPCAPGSIGRIVVTPLHNFAMPLIRYEIGDLAEVGTPCPCGRGLPVLSRILGRARDLLRLPADERRFSLQAAPIFRHVPGILQFQIVQRSPDRIELRLIIDPEFDRAHEGALIAALRHRLPGMTAVELCYPLAIERDPGGSFPEFYSQV